MATFVLVHGGWDGGWAWRETVRILRAADHEAFAPTLTGSGERVHLARPDIDLDTHVEDIANVLRYEDLRDVILVGASSGGMVVTAVAERVPERIRRLVYVDALVPRDGESLYDIVGPDAAAWFEARAAELGGGWRVPHVPPDADRRTDFIVNVGRGHVRLESQAAAALPRTYVRCTEKPADWQLTPIIDRVAARARDAGWDYRELATGHYPPLSDPRKLADQLLELA